MNNGQAVSPRELTRPDLSWILEESDWTPSPYNPVKTDQELYEAVENAVPGVPTQIQIGTNISLRQIVASDGMFVPEGAVVMVTSIPGGHFTINGNALYPHRAFYVEKSTLYLRDITIENAGRGEGERAVEAAAGTVVMQRDSIIKNCSSGAIRLFYYDDDATNGVSQAVLMDNALIEDCSADGDAAGIYSREAGAAVMMDDAQIRDCHPRYGSGGAITLYGEDDQQAEIFMLGRAAITECSAPENGGAIAAEYCDILITDDARISECNLVVEIDYSGRLALYGESGGALYLENCELEISGNASITQNEAQIDGGGLYLRSGAHGTLKDSALIQGNIAAGDGGGIYVGDGASLTIEEAADIRIEDNDALGGDGGGIWDFLSPNPALLIPAGVSFSGNHASRACAYPSEAVRAVETQAVSATVFTAPFVFAYNNYDVNVSDADCIADAPNAAVGGYVQACCHKDIDGLFTLLLTDSGGNIIGESQNDARGKFAIDLSGMFTRGGQSYSISQKIDADGFRQDKRKFPVVIAVGIDGKTNVSYPRGRPFFLNFCR